MSIAHQVETAPGRFSERPLKMPVAGWWAAFKRAFIRAMDADVSLKSAGAGFFAFLALFPALSCFVILYGLFAERSTLVDHLQVIGPLLPASVYDVVVERLKALVDQPETELGIGLIVSFAIALWSGSRGVSAIITLMNDAYREEDERSFVLSAGLSLVLTLGGMVLVIFTLLLVAALPAALAALPFSGTLGTVVSLARWPLLAIVIGGALMVLFRVAPHRSSARWPWVWPGALLATILWMILSIGFSIYVANFASYDATFGTLSVAVVMMLWFYYSTMVVALGAILNAELERQTRVDTTTGPSRPMGERGAVVADTVAH